MKRCPASMPPSPGAAGASARRCASSPLDDEQGHVALGLALRHLANTGIFMMATAHPDDENNGLLVMLNRGQGFRTALATATRGNGGQNEIGPEIFEALGVLRTEELAALHRFDGAEQYFTRAVDFGYSFSIDETIREVGARRDHRRLRAADPDDPARRHHRAESRTAPAAGQHHQACRRSCRARRSSWRAIRRSIPEQIQGRPASVAAEEVLLRRRFRRRARRRQPAPARAMPTSNLAVYDPLLGRTYAEIGTEARSMHKCQGGAAAGAARAVVGQLPARRIDDSRADAAATSGRCSTASTRRSRPRAACRRPRRREISLDGLAAIASAVQTRAEAVRHRRRPARRCSRCSTGLARRARAARAARATSPSTTTARFEIDFRLAPEGARVPAGHRHRRTASASKRWPTTASSCPASRCASRSSSPIAARPM